MKKMTVDEMRHCVGGKTLPAGGTVLTVTGVTLSPDYGCLCDYHIVGNTGAQWDVCEVQCEMRHCQDRGLVP